MSEPWDDAADVRWMPDERALADLKGRLQPGEKVRLLCSPLQWHNETGLLTKGRITAVVTSRRVLLIKKGLLGMRAAEYPILDFVGWRIGLYMGGGPTWEFYSKMQRGSIKLVFRTHDEAEMLEAHINGGVVLAREGIE